MSDEEAPQPASPPPADEPDSPDGPSAPKRSLSLALVLVCVAATMALGIALRSPCADGTWENEEQYRHLCYSDIVPLLGTEQIASGRLPYVQPCARVEGQNCDEYPALTMYSMRLAVLLAGGSDAHPASYPAFFYANAAILLACALVTGACLYLMAGGRRALWFALSPTLLVYGTLNWDLLAVALATTGTLALLVRKEGGAGALLGLGGAAKAYPLLLAPAFVADRLRHRRTDGAIRVAWGAAAGWLAANAAFILFAGPEWSEFFRFNSARPADWDSLWRIGCRHVGLLCTSTPVLNAASALAFFGAVAWIWIAKRRSDPGFPRWTLGFAILVAFLLTNKVYSPQYSLWLVPWFALVSPRLRTFVAFEITDVAVFLTRFTMFVRFTGEDWGAEQWMFEAAILVRAAVLVWAVVEWIRSTHAPLPVEAAERPRTGSPQPVRVLP